MKNKLINSGFTLVEIVVVMVIIGIMASVAMPKFKHTQELARAEEGVAFLRMAHNQIKNYKIEHGTFPTSASFLDMYAGTAVTDLKYFRLTGINFYMYRADGRARIQRNSPPYYQLLTTVEGAIECNQRGDPSLCNAIEARFN